MDRYDFMRRPRCNRANCRIIVNTCTHKLHLIIDDNLYKSYPIAVGKMLDKIHPSTYEIVDKKCNPGGRYGARWIGLNKKHYGIHGTDDPFSIGRSVSHGCIRVHNKDILNLVRYVWVGTRVKIV